jgi:hypothetical protein
MPDLVDYLVAALLGALVGGTELVSRYRDAPQSALLSRPAWLYVFLNASASALALWLAMALFRTSLFTVRAGDRDVGVGPGSLLQTLRDAVDREVDRARGQARGSRLLS